jgi:hypothetical protein
VTDLILLLIFVALIAIGFMVNGISRRLENVTDLSKEDEAVKLATDEVKSARKRIPPQK